jgi:hypothetical protein
MKGGLYGITAPFLILTLSYCLLCFFSSVEARDFRAEVIRRGGIGPVIPTPQSMPKEDIIHHEKVGDFKFYQRAEIDIQWLQISPEKVDVDIIDRRLKENVMPAFNPMDHSPGIGHNSPPHH